MSGISKEFWLNFAKNGVSSSIENRVAAADRLDKFLTWIWGVYTSVFTVAALFNLLSSDWRQLISVAQPIIIIMYAKYLCACVSMPSSSDEYAADPNHIPSIIRSFLKIVSDKKVRLKRANIWVGLSIISLTIALVGYNIFDPHTKLRAEITNLDQIKKKKELEQEVYWSLKMDSLENLNKLLDLQYSLAVSKTREDCFYKQKIICPDSLVSK